MSVPIGSKYSFVSTFLLDSIKLFNCLVFWLFLKSAPRKLCIWNYYFFKRIKKCINKYEVYFYLIFQSVKDKNICIIFVMETREREKIISSNVDKVYMGGGAVGAQYGDM